MIAQAAEQHRLHVGRLDQLAGRTREPNRPSHAAASSSVETVPSPWRIAALVADARRGQVRIGRVPEARRLLLAPRPTLEAVAVGCPVVKQVPRPREARRVAPHAGQAVRRLGDEVLEIALPAAAVVREEQQLVRPRQQHPAREMDRADLAQEARAKAFGRQLPMTQNAMRSVKPRSQPGCMIEMPARWFCWDQFS